MWSACGFFTSNFLVFWCLARERQATDCITPNRVAMARCDRPSSFKITIWATVLAEIFLLFPILLSGFLCLQRIESGYIYIIKNFISLVAAQQQCHTRIWPVFICMHFNKIKYVCVCFWMSDANFMASMVELAASVRLWSVGCVKSTLGWLDVIGWLCEEWYDWMIGLVAKWLRVLLVSGTWVGRRVVCGVVCVEKLRVGIRLTQLLCVCVYIYMCVYLCAYLYMCVCVRVTKIKLVHVFWFNFNRLIHRSILSCVVEIKFYWPTAIGQRSDLLTLTHAVTAAILQWCAPPPMSVETADKQHRLSVKPEMLKPRLWEWAWAKWSVQQPSESHVPWLTPSELVKLDRCAVVNRFTNTYLFTIV